jgi:hypothetical protein
VLRASDLPWSTLMDDDPSVEQSGSSKPMIYSGEVVIALKPASLLASCLSLLDPPPHNIGTPTIPDGGEGTGDQSESELYIPFVEGGHTIAPAKFACKFFQTGTEGHTCLDTVRCQSSSPTGISITP